MKKIVLCMPLLALSACAEKWIPPPAMFEVHSASFIDLMPGWRVRVVTPLLKSGGYQLRDLKATPAGGDDRGLTLSAHDEEDFLGYETAYYAVNQRGAGIRIDLSSVEMTRENQTFSEARSIVPLFHLPPNTKYVRLLFLQRVSSSDHDMAVIAAGSLQSLDAATARVQANAEACGNGSEALCSWVPAGIAVRPEKRLDKDWVPAAR